MGNIGNLSSVGQVKNNGSDQELKTMSFYDSFLTFETKGLQFNNKIYNSNYESVTKSSNKRLPTKSATLPSNVGFPVFADFGKLYQIRFGSNNTFYLDEINLLTGGVTTKQYVDNTRATYSGSDLLRINNELYIAEFNGNNNKIKFAYHKIGKATSTNFYEFKDEVNLTIGHIIPPALYDCATDNIFLIVSQKVYKYDFFNNTYTLITTLPSLSRLCDCVYDNILYSFTNDGKLVKFNLIDGSNFEIIGSITTSTFTNTHIVACKDLICGSYIQNSYCYDFYFDILNGTLQSGLVTATNYNTVNSVNLVNFGVSVVACNTSSDLRISCSTIDCYNLKDKTNSYRLYGIVDL